MALVVPCINDGMIGRGLKPGPIQRAAPAPAFKLNAEGSVAVSTEVYWNEDMRQCPRGSKCQLLGAGGVAVYGNYDGAPFWVGWAPVPKRRGV